MSEKETTVAIVGEGKKMIEGKGASFGEKDAFFGGRTGATLLEVKSNEVQWIVNGEGM